MQLTPECSAGDAAATPQGGMCRRTQTHREIPGEGAMRIVGLDHRVVKAFR